MIGSYRTLTNTMLNCHRLRNIRHQSAISEVYVGQTSKMSILHRVLPDYCSCAFCYPTIGISLQQLFRIYCSFLHHKSDLCCAIKSDSGQYGAIIHTRNLSSISVFLARLCLPLTLRMITSICRQKQNIFVSVTRVHYIFSTKIKDRESERAIQSFSYVAMIRKVTTY